MPPFEPGLYELLITEALAAQLGSVADALEPLKEDLRPTAQAARTVARPPHHARHLADPLALGLRSQTTCRP